MSGVRVFRSTREFEKVYPDKMPAGKVSGYGHGFTKKEAMNAAIEDARDRIPSNYNTLVLTETTRQHFPFPRLRRTMLGMGNGQFEYRVKARIYDI